MVLIIDLRLLRLANSLKNRRSVLNLLVKFSLNYFWQWIDNFT